MLSCPDCDQPLGPDEVRCPRCGLRLEAVGQETPQAPREPAVRRRNAPAWRDEVRERVRGRRRDRGIEEEDLPLFRRPTPPPLILGEAPEEEDEPEPLESEPPQVHEPAVRARVEPDDALANFDLHTDTPPVEPAPRRPVIEEPPLDALEPAVEDVEDDWPVGAPERVEVRALERPASPMERTQAATIDLSLLLVLDAFILYFSARAARVDLAGLMATWQYLAAYLGALALVYAGYFTGLMGRTPGKMILGLRVVDTHGEAPGFLRALVRAVLGIVGSALLFIGHVPAFFDPAHRALHDRLVGTRVVRT